MTCEHLIKLETELIQQGITETTRGQVWSENCREWVYFNCLFSDLEQTINRLHLDKSHIKIHSHCGTHDGQEHGLYCSTCKDAIMGIHPEYAKGMSNEPIKFI